MLQSIVPARKRSDLVNCPGIARELADHVRPAARLLLIVACNFDEAAPGRVSARRCTEHDNSLSSA
ncbi:MAG: hypothetical protein P8J78_05620 [Maricaulis sp.]|nr:hypothetical protein [Maricaulis sp.]MDG2044068.1 hypothetical protein [Maricaulis sp.]